MGVNNMNSRIVMFFTFCSSFLIASSTAMSQISIIQTSSSDSTIVSPQGQSTQAQETAITIDSASLGQPYILSLSASQGTQLTGQITLNGRVIQELKDNQASINLSPLLSKGRQEIKISGNYQPVQSSVKVEFSGPGTQVTQLTSGNGILNQTLIIDVQ